MPHARSAMFGHPELSERNPRLFRVAIALRFRKLVADLLSARGVLASAFPCGRLRAAVAGVIAPALSCFLGSSFKPPGLVLPTPDVSSHSRKPPRNALALSPALQRSGSFFKFLTSPPPSTMSSTWILVRKSATISSTRFRHFFLPNLLRPRTPTYCSYVLFLYGRCAISLDSATPFITSAVPRSVPNPKKSIFPPL